jgi:drug/metabolite transporter (DMT)-like permease
MENFNSKKFAAFLISLIVLTTLLGFALFTQTFTWSMTMFMCIGILGIVCLVLGYILTQRKLDTVKTLMSDLINKDRSNEENDEN